VTISSTGATANLTGGGKLALDAGVTIS
jgi:hypothetical protein